MELIKAFLENLGQAAGLQAGGAKGLLFVKSIESLKTFFLKLSLPLFFKMTYITTANRQ